MSCLGRMLERFREFGVIGIFRIVSGVVCRSVLGIGRVVRCSIVGYGCVRLFRVVFGRKRVFVRSGTHSGRMDDSR